MRSNPRIATFLDKLKDAGVLVNLMWSAKRPNTKKFDDVNFVAFVGNGFSPSVATAIIIDYGPRDGFGIYGDNFPNDFDAMVAMIAKPRDGTSDNEAREPKPADAALVEARAYIDGTRAYVKSDLLAKIDAAIGKEDTAFDLLCESLSAWEGEEESVKEEHADLIAKLNAYVEAHRPAKIA